jgi:hypothetical protein
MRHLLLLIIASLAFAGEATVNPVIKSSLDTYESDAAKAYADYLKAVSKVNDKTVKDLDVKFKTAMKKGDLDLANAIKKQIEQITAGETLADLENKWKEELGKSLLPDSNVNPTVVIGTWTRNLKNRIYTFNADGTFTQNGVETNNGKWTMTKDRVIMTANEGSVTTLTIKSATEMVGSMSDGAAVTFVRK